MMSVENSRKIRGLASRNSLADINAMNRKRLFSIFRILFRDGFFHADFECVKVSVSRSHAVAALFRQRLAGAHRAYSVITRG